MLPLGKQELQNILLQLLLGAILHPGYDSSHNSDKLSMKRKHATTYWVDMVLCILLI